MKRTTFFFSASALFLCIVEPVIAHAALSPSFGPIISTACNCDPVGGITANGVTVASSAPAWGCILATFQNAINFLVAFSAVIITIFIAWAGVTYMTSGGSPEKRSTANRRIMNAVIGLVITLCAWLLIDSLMKVIYNPNAGFGPWNSILAGNGAADCLVPVKNAPQLPGGAAATNPNTAPTPPAQQSTVPATPPAACGSVTHLNCSAAVSWLTSNVTTTQDQGICLTDIQRALSAGGVTLQCGAPPGHSGYAGYCNSSLQALGFTALGATDPSPLPGDIIVIQHSTGTMIGHIAMWTGSAWVSDFVQSSSESPPGNPYGSAGYNPQYWRP
jgi:hypothetical protein